MQDAYDHPGRKRRKRSPTGAPPPQSGKTRWEVLPRTNAIAGKWNDLCELGRGTDGKGGWN